MAKDLNRILKNGLKGFVMDPPRLTHPTELDRGNTYENGEFTDCLLDTMGDIVLSLCSVYPSYSFCNGSVRRHSSE